MPPTLRNSLPRAGAMGLFALVVAAVLFVILGHSHQAGDAAKISPSGNWTCSMCPQFILSEPGKCPKCFMDLIPLDAGSYGGGKRELVLPRDAVALAGIESVMVERDDAPADPDPNHPDDQPLLYLPATAVLRNLGRAFVFVEVDEGDALSFTMREIEIGPRSGDRLAVLSGVDEGERVAASGLFRIDSAMQILGKVSLSNLPDGDLALVDEDAAEPFQPAERSELDLRAEGLALDDWFGRYEAVRAALARDDDAIAAASARDLSSLLAAAGEGGEFADLRTLLAADATSLAGASNLEVKRSAFEKISADMVLLARRYGSPAGGLNLVFCPMAFGGAGAHWLQPGQTVDNPYHGLEMPLCGWLVESIPDRDSD